jgi:hypothetical protein
MEACNYLHALVALAPEPNDIRDWEGHIGGPDAVEKRKISFPCLESNHNLSAVRPVSDVFLE